MIGAKVRMSVDTVQCASLMSIWKCLCDDSFFVFMTLFDSSSLIVHKKPVAIKWATKVFSTF